MTQRRTPFNAYRPSCDRSCLKTVAPNRGKGYAPAL